MKTSWEKLADIDDNIEQQLELVQSPSSASNPTIPLVRVVPFRRMRSSTIAGTVSESLESSLDSYRRQNNQTIKNKQKKNKKTGNASSAVHTSAEFTRSRNRVFCSDPSILLKVDKDLLPEISTPVLKHHHLPIIQKRKLSNFSASEGFLQPNRNFMSASSTPPLQSVASSSFSFSSDDKNLISLVLFFSTKIFATHHSESFAADRTSTVKECSGPAHRLRDKFAASISFSINYPVKIVGVALKLQAQAMGEKAVSICLKG
ncbi:hypothetical protein T4B_10132 [Trichinella pseudospiralis]|uniref:Uncharacterized protein n=1 Tax=Trichinella pseudospiralis TaxID=6337 RepID=A0A0V1I4J9_TRIPS|nr:hypothetical protein T4B_10132 [Trichinella pseudospiralis]